MESSEDREEPGGLIAEGYKSALTKERRELRDQQRRQLLDSISKDLNRPRRRLGKDKSLRSFEDH